MADWTVRRRGTDPNGRSIYASDFMWDWWLGCCDELGFTPTIVQGAWMTLAGGGAGASAGYHDGGGCFDLRLWDRTDDERKAMIRVFRSRGAAYWERYESQGFDLHAHFVLGSDHDLDDGAAYQWRQYLDGRNGLASNGPDYHWRPSPLVTKPPEDDMPYTEAELTRIVRDAVKDSIPAIAREVTQTILGADLFPKREDIERTVREALTEASNRKGARDGRG